MLVYRGQVSGQPVDEVIPSLSGSFSFPLKYGYSAVGRVISVGNGVEQYWLGRLVFTFHPHESLFTVPVSELMPLPDNISPEDAAFLPGMETAVNPGNGWMAFVGEQVAVFGQGIIGLLTTALRRGSL